MPVTVKDTLDVEGLPASAGMVSLLGRTVRDAVVVSSLRAAGAIVWGKTNTPVKAADWQAYNALYGTMNNPFDLARTPGGSSADRRLYPAAGSSMVAVKPWPGVLSMMSAPPWSSANAFTSVRPRPAPAA